MSLFKQFGTSKEAEQDGIWVEYGPNEDGTIPGFKITRMTNTNKRWLKAHERITRPHRFAIDRKTIDEGLAQKLMIQVLAEGILLDWRNVNDEDGKPLAFTKENAVWLLLALPDLYNELNQKANEVANFRKEERELEAKN